MAKKDTTVDTDAPDTQQDVLTQVLGKLMRDSDAGPIPQISRSKALYRTPWNPTGSKNRPKLSGPMRMNGNELRERMLSNEEITLLNQVKPGRYQNQRWTVIETTGGSEGGASKFIYIPNKTAEERMEIAQKARNLAELLQIMIDEGPSRA